MTADKLVDKIFEEFFAARKARKPANVRKHLNQAEWLFIELDETLRYEGVELENIETPNGDMEDDDE